MRPEDIRYVFGAYKMGSLPPLAFPEGLSAPEFTKLFFNLADRFESEHIIEDGRPLGLAFAHEHEGYFEPHSMWFPWASPRQILQGTAKYLDKRRQERWGVIYAPVETRSFHMHLVKYGILRPVGKFHFYPAQPMYVYEIIPR